MEANQPTTRFVVGITGRLGTGKTTAARYLSTQHGFNYIRYSQILADWFQEDPNRKANLQLMGWEVMSGGLQAELNARLMAQMTSEVDWVVDGLRHTLDYESLKNAFTSSFHMLYIDSPRQERWVRLQKHLRFCTFDDFCVADSHAVEQQIEALQQVAEAGIQNSGSIEDLYEKLTRFVIGMRKENL
jgi:dephospho-CoA kinase